MPKFMCLQVSDPTTAGPEKPSPEQMQAMYAKFNAWRETFEDHIVDPGGPLKRQGKLLTANGDIDGPAIETKELIGGYMILSAETLEEAIEIARACPGVVRPGSSMVVREINMP